VPVVGGTPVDITLKVKVTVAIPIKEKVAYEKLLVTVTWQSNALASNAGAPAIFEVGRTEELYKTWEIEEEGHDWVDVEYESTDIEVGGGSPD
jgi:hypothetical protein